MDSPTSPSTAKSAMNYIMKIAAMVSDQKVGCEISFPLRFLDVNPLGPKLDSTVSLNAYCD